MLKNYLLVALRSLRKHKAYAAINITGLAVGLTCCLLIVLFVQDERSYDQFHEAAEQIYRMNRSDHAGTWTTAGSSPPIAPSLMATFPEVEEATRFVYGPQLPIQSSPATTLTQDVVFADPNFLSVFDFPLLQGDRATALSAPDGVILTETAARAYFGDADPMGQSLALHVSAGTQDVQVTGILADVPRNAHFHFDVLASFQPIAARSNRMDNWISNWLYTYVRLTPEASADALAAKFPAFFESHVADFPFAFSLQNITDIHLNPVGFEIEPQGDMTYVYMFSLVAVFILLIACFNFMNLATARSAERAKEVGMRKVLGAHRQQLVRQFLGESVLVSLLAALVVIGLLELLLPVFNTLSSKTLVLDYTQNIWLVGTLVLGSLGVGLLAGIYPALFMTHVPLVQVLKGEANRGVRGARFRQLLVVTQFAISIFLMAATAIVYNQLTYVQSANLGFDKDHVVVVPLPSVSAERVTTIKRQFAQLPDVTDVSATSNVPGQGVGDYLYVPETLGANDPAAPYWLTYFVDFDFAATLKLQTLEGATFQADQASDSSGFVINAAAAAALQTIWGQEGSVVGRTLDWHVPSSSGWVSQRTGPILAVVDDFHYASLHSPVSPMVLQILPRGHDWLLVRLQPGPLSEALATLETTWAGLFPDQAFDYSFLDTNLAALYQAEQRMAQIIGVFALLAILTACLGLFGLVAFTAERRTKELGLRKVLGASVTSLVLLLSNAFARLVAVAFLVAAPLTYIIMNDWLGTFAYRIDVGVGTLIGAGLAACLIAFATVSYQALRAARANPIDALRYE